MSGQPFLNAIAIMFGTTLGIVGLYAMTHSTTTPTRAECAAICARG